MDSIRFEVERADTPTWGPRDLVEVFINDRNLVDLVREVELPFAARYGKPGLAGSYIGLPLEEIFYPSRRLFGEPETYYDADYPDGKLAVLGCGCGEVGCWPLRVRITVQDDIVVWDDFEQPHRRGWRHEGLGPFVFERRSHEAALRG